MQVVQLGGRQNGDAQRESTTREFEIFDGDGVETVFTLTDTEAVPDQVDVGGQTLRPGIDYTVAGNVVTMDFAPADLADSVVISYFTEINLTADPLSRINVDTTGASIVLNFGSKKQRNFLGNLPIAGNKNILKTNTSVALKGVFGASIDAALRVLTFESDVKSNDGGWNNATQQWTCAAPGEYVIELTFTGTYWSAVFNGPNT